MRPRTVCYILRATVLDEYCVHIRSAGSRQDIVLLSQLNKPRVPSSLRENPPGKLPPLALHVSISAIARFGDDKR